MFFIAHRGRRRAAAVLLQGRRPRLRPGGRRHDASPSRLYDGNGMFLSVGNVTENRVSVGAARSSTSPTAPRSAASTARRPSQPADPLARATSPAPSSSSGSRARAVFPNCRGTSTPTVRTPLGLRARRRARTAPCRTGNATSGSTGRSRPTTRRSTRPTRARRRSRGSEWSDRRRRPDLEAPSAALAFRARVELAAAPCAVAVGVRLARSRASVALGPASPVHRSGLDGARETVHAEPAAWSRLACGRVEGIA